MKIRLLDRLRHPLQGVLAAAAVGTTCAQLVICWTSLCGSADVSLVALVAGFAGGAIAAEWLSESLGTGSRGLHRILLGGLFGGFAWLTPQLLNVTLLAGSETFSQASSLFSVLTLMFPAAIVSAGICLAGTFFRVCRPDPASGTQSGRIEQQANRRSGFKTPASGWFQFGSYQTLLGGCTGLLFSTVHFLVEWPLAISVVCSIVAALVVCNWRASLTELAPKVSDIPDEFRIRARSAVDRGRFIPELLQLAAMGILAVAVCEILSRVISISVPILLCSALLTGAALVVLCLVPVRRIVSAEVQMSVSLLWVALLPWLLPQLAEFQLGTFMQSAGPALLLLMRSLQLTVFLTPIWLLGIQVGDRSEFRWSIRFSALAVAIGMIAAIVGVSRGWAPSIVLASGILLQAISRIKLRPARMLPHVHTHTDASRPANRRSVLKTGLAAAACFAAAIISAVAHWDPAPVSSLVFSSRTQAALHRGIEKGLIPQSESSRLVVAMPGETGDLAVWRKAGSLLEFQRNGQSLGRVSIDTSLSPQPPEEILPAIMGLVIHPQPARVLLLGDDTGACLRTCTHFPLRDIVAVRGDRRLTHLANQFTWSGLQTPVDQDSRVTILHQPQMLALRNRRLKPFEVIVAAGESLLQPSAAYQFTAEYYAAVKSRLTSDGVFCQRIRQEHSDPDPVRQVLSTLMTIFEHVGAVQTVPGDILVFATNDADGLVDPEVLTRLQRPHVRQEITSAGWDWSQVAVLPFLNANDPIGLFSHEKRPRVISIRSGGLTLSAAIDALDRRNRQAEMVASFGPHQMQFLASIPPNEEHAEVQRRLSALAQQVEILAGMPDQPWTYRKSLRMEMQRSPRAPLEIVQSGEVVKVAHPLDELRKNYFESLGLALRSLSDAPAAVPGAIQSLDAFTSCGEPLISFFSNYEIVRLHELARHPEPSDELTHRLRIVFQAGSSDASVRPVISALDQLTRNTRLIASPQERYDVLNSLVQKLIERWEARTAWEPKSALRVQNDVDQSVRVTNRALEEMESLLADVQVSREEFFSRRRFVNFALISPLRDYRDRVLAHRMKTEGPEEPGTEDPDDMPLLVPNQSTAKPSGLNTN